MSNVVKYTLSIDSKGFAVNGSSDGTTRLDVTTDSKAVISYKNVVMFVSLYGLSFCRKVYEPGHIQAELLFQTEYQTAIVGMRYFLQLFLHRPVNLLVTNGSASPVTVAGNYYIHELFPLVEKGKRLLSEDPDGPKADCYNIYVRLDIFSPDKLLTLNKYSQAHLGKKLIEEIVTETLPKFKVYYSGIQGGVPTTYGPVTIEKEASVRTLHHLSYKKTETTREEFIHPYLVQYNESFYDFLRRVANRTGDIFYYEGGKLCFGVGGSTGASIPDGAQIGFQRISEDPLTVHDYARDTVKGFWSESYANSGEQPTVTNTVKPGSGVSQQEDIPKGTDGFPLDAFATLEQKYADDFLHFYNSEIAPDDHYMVLYKDNYARPFKNYFFKWGKYSMGYISDILNSTSLLEVISNVILKTEDLTFRSTGMYVPDKKKGEKLVKDAGGSSSAVLLYGVDDDSTQWVKLSDLYSVKTLSGEQMRKMICIDMGTGFQPFQLGETFKYNDLDSTITDDKQLTTYVVVGIEMNNGVVWQRDYEGFTGEGSHRKGVAQTLFQRVYAIPMAEGVFYPPLLPGKPFRESGPQPAFVIDSEDPTGQGRVRVRFAWQPALKDQHHIVETTSDASAKSAAQEKIQKEENATPWIRMVMPMASTGAGVFFKPVAGDEVMVDFENGNVERPFVAGSLYSKNVVTPYERAIVSRNGHSIIFRDYDDATYLVSGLNPGLKQLALWGVKFPGLEGDAREALGGIEITDKMGLYNVKLCSHNRSISIASPFGDINISALTGITIKAPNGDIRIEGKNVDVSAYNKITLTSGKNVKMALDKYSRGSFFTSLANPKQAGSAIAKTVADGTYGKFFDLSLLRSLVEIFIRPVDGTFEIKSNRYLLLEAGEGSADATSDKYNKSWQRSLVDFVSATPPTLNDEMQALTWLINHAVSLVHAPAQAFSQTFANLANIQVCTDQQYTDVYSSPGDKESFLTEVFKIHYENTQPTYLDQKKEFIIGKCKKKDTQNIQGSAQAVTNMLDSAVTAAATIRVAADAYMKCLDKLTFANNSTEQLAKSLFGSAFLKEASSILLMKNPETASQAAVQGGDGITPYPALPIQEQPNRAGAQPSTFITELLTVLDVLTGKANVDQSFLNIQASQLDQNWLKFVNKRLVAFIIEKCRSKNPFHCMKILPAYYLSTPPQQPQGNATINMPGDSQFPFSSADWPLYIREISLTSDLQAPEDFASGLAEGFLDPLKKVFVYESDIWKANAKGEIIFSDRRESSHHFDQQNQGTITRYDNRILDNEPAAIAAKPTLQNCITGLGL